MYTVQNIPPVIPVRSRISDLRPYCIYIYQASPSRSADLGSVLPSRLQRRQVYGQADTLDTYGS